jgi:hypothetical protein
VADFVAAETYRTRRPCALAALAALADGIAIEIATAAGDEAVPPGAPPLPGAWTGGRLEAPPPPPPPQAASEAAARQYETKNANRRARMS